MPIISPEIASIEKKISWLITPVHLVLSSLLAGALLLGVYLLESKRAVMAETKAEAAAQVAEVAKQAAVSSALQNAANQEQAKQVEASMAAVSAQLQVANQQLQAANRQLVAALADRQKADALLTPQDQAARWAQLVPMAKVQATPEGFTVDPVGGLDTIKALEELPIDRSVIANLTVQVKNDEKTISNDAVSLAAEKAAHKSDLDNDQKQLDASQKETKKVRDDFDSYKTKTHKNFLKVFFAGVIVGILEGHAVGF